MGSTAMFWHSFNGIDLQEFRPGIRSKAEFRDKLVMTCMEIGPEKEDAGHQHLFDLKAKIYELFTDPPALNCLHCPSSKHASLRQNGSIPPGLFRPIQRNVGTFDKCLNTFIGFQLADTETGRYSIRVIEQIRN